MKISAFFRHRELARLTLICLTPVLMLAACNEDDDEDSPATTQQDDQKKEDSTENPVDTVGQKDTVDQPVSIAPLLVRNWRIKKATGADKHDPQTTGKSLKMMEGGAYLFDNSFKGTWQLEEGEESLLMDKGTTFQATWVIEEISERSFIVSFPSPWDGKRTPLRWEMVPR